MENEENENLSDDKKITVVSGDGEDLDISKVYNHINIEDNSSEEPKNNVVIPTEKKSE